MSLDEKLEVLKRPDASVDELGNALHDLGEEGDPSLHPHVAPFLAHPSPRLRHMALNVLAFHWVLPQYRERFEDMLVTDPEEDGWVREEAAGCLGAVLEGTRDKAAARLLITRLQNSSERDNVRQAAYRALLEIWAPDRARDYDRSASRQTEEHSRLLEKAREAREKGDKEAAEALFTEADEAWKRWVDWQLVDAIEREVA